MTAATTVSERALDRATILDRLRQTVASGDPIIAVAAGAGIVAKCAEVGGADLIVVECTGRSRHLGVPTTVTLGNANTTTLQLYRQIDNVVDRTPIVGGAEATDPTRRRLSGLLREYQQAGFDGIGNFPTVGALPNWGRARSDVGHGIERESELIALARRAGMFTVGFAYAADQARALSAAGADVLVARCGVTAGGLSGPAAALLDKPAAAALVQEILEAARAEQPEILVLAHGGPWVTPEDTDELYAQTDAQGFLGESSIERIPIETAVAEAAREYKRQPLRASARG
jgi:predicted TIM-barrel enzyme